MSKSIKCWKQVQCREDTFYLIDLGVVIQTQDLSHLKKVFKNDDDQRITEYFAERFSERYQNRESAEIILESLLLWLSSNMQEIHLIAFLQKILEHPDRNDIICALPGLFLSLEFLDQKHQEDAFDLAVFLVAQTGIQLNHFGELFPEEFGDTKMVVDHLNAFMISISNISSYRARLCLLNYFAMVEKKKSGNTYFNRIMERFGTTLLNQVFHHLFDKKTEMFAFQYLVDNLPHIFLTDKVTQFTLQEIMRYNMLKHPDKFTQFVKAFLPLFKKSLAKFPRECQETMVENYLKHMAMLLRVVSQVDHPKISKELLITLCSFKEFPYCAQLAKQLIRTTEIKIFYRDLLRRLMERDKKEREYIEGLSRFRSRKRGRRPRIEQRDLSIFQQVFYLKD